VDSVKFVGYLYSFDVIRQGMPDGNLRPHVHVRSSQGAIRPTFLCSPPRGAPGEGRVLLLSCEPLMRLDQNRESSLVFLGGFDPPRIVDDVTQPTTVLAFSYPLTNPDELRERIGSIDFTPQAVNLAVKLALPLAATGQGTDPACPGLVKPPA